MPVRNRENLVGRTLDSIYAQNYRPLKLIIVDNGSTDRTAAVVKSWIEAHRDEDFSIKMLVEPETGASRARNKGLKEVETEYVMFFDSDDVMEFDHLSRIMGHLEKHPETELLHWGISLRDSDGWTVQKNPGTDSDLMTEHILHGTLSTQRYCTRTETHRSIGGWNEELSTWDDLEMGVRLLRTVDKEKTHRLTGSPRVFADIQDDSLTGPSFSSRADAHSRVLDRMEELLGYDRRLCLMVSARRVITAAIYRREGNKVGARIQLNKALEPYGRVERLKLRTIYACQLIFGRGGSAIALHSFPPEAENANG